MMQMYADNKDLYATIATTMYHNNYEDNLEANGLEAQERRSSAKPLMLGISYGMGVSSIAEKLNTTPQKAQEFFDSFFAKFKGVKKWMDDTKDYVKQYGYVEDLWGRRRHLDEASLPEYEITLKNKDSSSFNPFLCCENISPAISQKIKTYLEKLNNTNNSKELYKVKSEIEKDGFNVICNSIKISGAERQCVNARIQGSAATMTKIAMIKVSTDEELKRMGFKLLIGVHDELIGEVNAEYAQEAGDRLAYIMRTCVSDYVTVPFNCDATIVKRWYEDQFIKSIKKDFTKRLAKNESKEDIINSIYKSHSELDKSELDYYINEALN